jgi:hydroxymethylbilane synthase
VASLDGQQLLKESISGPAPQAEQLGEDLAQKLRKEGAGEILAAILAEIERS